MIIRLTTKELFAESLKELSATKPIYKITIREIAQNCGFTSKTFYNHFQDKYDLIAWIYSTAAEKIMKKIDGENYTWKDSLIDGFNYFLENKEFLKNLVTHTSGQDSFINYVAQFNVKILSDYIKRSQNFEKLSPDLEISIKVYCYGTVCTFCEMLTNPTLISDEEFVNSIEKSLPEPLKKFLYKN